MAWEDDETLPEDAEIEASHPTRSGRHAEWAQAMRLVGAKKSKGSLVALVTWLLCRLSDAKADGRREALAEAQKYALDAAIEAGWQDALAEASDKCATFVRERMSTAARIAEEPPELRGDREVWVRLKASEAQRCVDAIRKLAVRP